MTRHPMNRAKKPNTRESEELLREVYITSAFPSRCTNATRWKCSGICCAGDDCTQGSPVCASLDAHPGKNIFLTYERVCTQHPSLYLDCRQWTEKAER